MDAESYWRALHDPLRSPKTHALLQQYVTSTSEMPEPPATSPALPLIVAPCYFPQIHALMEHQRQVHQKERELWHIERTGLYEKINKLESALRDLQEYQSTLAHQGSFSGRKNRRNRKKERKGNGTSSTSALLGTDASRHTTGIESQEAVWHPKPKVPPSRVFSDSVPQRLEARLQDSPKAERNTTPGRKDPRKDPPRSRDVLTQPRIDTPQVYKDIDGVIFRRYPRQTSNTQNIMTPQSPSPKPSSPGRVSPHAIESAYTRLSALENPYTKHAGHTPLASRTNLGTDGATSLPPSESATPTQPETDPPPSNRRTVRLKRPSERSESYFPSSQPNETGDADPELKGPLGLTNAQPEDDAFLAELNSRLATAAAAAGYKPAAVAGTSASEEPPKEEESTDFEQPEEEPKLKLKRSMNFGSIFGDGTLGKGV